jgi:alkylation response protein AidB-like acyl-CoA dehydrogenase
MALNMLVDSRDVRFVLFEMLKVDELVKYDKFSGFDRDTFESTLELAEKISVKDIYPANAAGDKEGTKYNPVTKEVTVPQLYHKARQIVNEAGFPGIEHDPDWGGMGMPNVLYRSVLEYLFAGSLAYTMYLTLSAGATGLVSHWASDDLKKMFLEKMISGEWGGTMCLTEPEAGSDVGALKTKAVKHIDGTYRIKGQKIFISSGDNDLYPNMVHPVLARLEGDPAGTKGISIFLVPKYLVKPDGSIGEKNDVVCSGIEHKMGIKGSATCTLSFGDDDNCVGYLLGKEREGMKIMFQMMNEARIDVSIEALGVASSAYMHAVTYARNRKQGPDPADSSKQTVIMNHPDIRRMLLWMKSNVEGMRMASMFAAYNFDISTNAGGEEQKEAQALFELFIPICKAGNTDLAWLITAEAIQVFGGYGYCSDYPVEQLARDSKILAIYEGTNGIQSIDLTMRKLLMNPDMYNYRILRKRITETIAGAEKTVDHKYTSALKSGLLLMDDVIGFLMKLKTENKLNEIYSNATSLQVCFRMLGHAWLHLWSMELCLIELQKICGDVSPEKIKSAAKDNPEAAYYHGRLLSARFYIGSELKKFSGIAESILSGETAVTESFDEVFTGALNE